MKIQVIIGTTREGRFGDKPARWIAGLLQERADVEVEVLDLREYALPLYDESLSPSRLHGHYGDERIQRWVDKIAEGDGYVIVTAEYNHGYPAVLKNAIDYPFDQWQRKPVGFISYGSALGVRAVEQLRQVVIELQMAPIRHAIQIPIDIYTEVIKDPNQPNLAAFEVLSQPAGQFIDHLLWWTQVLKTGRETTTD